MKWVDYLLNVAYAVSLKSKDPRTKVGAVIADPMSHRILATGYNGFPSGVAETGERWERPLKYKYVVHAEANALLAAARFGTPVAGADLYVTLPPCAECAKLIAAAGLRRVYYAGSLTPDGTWRDDAQYAEAIFNEAGVRLINLKKE